MFVVRTVKYSVFQRAGLYTYIAFFCAQVCSRCGSLPRWSRLQQISFSCVPLPCMVPACRRLQLQISASCQQHLALLASIAFPHSRASSCAYLATSALHEACCSSPAILSCLQILASIIAGIGFGGYDYPVDGFGNCQFCRLSYRWGFRQPSQVAFCAPALHGDLH